MARRVTKLELDKIIRDKKPKRYSLGDGLYFTIKATGAMSFGVRYQIDRQTNYKGIGGFDRGSNNLGIARTKCDAYRVKIKQGIDPKIEEHNVTELRKQERVEQEKARLNTFRHIAELLIIDITPELAPKTLQSWKSQLRTYAYPVIGDMPVAKVTKHELVKILKPIWHTKPDLSKKLRQRIERVFVQAIFLELMGTNPALYKNNLEIVLRPIDKTKSKHFKALEYQKLPAFMAELSKRGEVGAKALKFTIFNATRTSETINAEWSEFNLKDGIWTIPAERMKMAVEHVIPLTKQSVQILTDLKTASIGQYVFANFNTGKPLSNGAMLAFLRRMGSGGKITVHGFRSTFRDCIAEETEFANIVAEKALAHAIPNAAEKAYRRGHLFKRRAKMMQWYADYVCSGQVKLATV
ncbi:MAG: integrase [Pseudomonadales bacterium]|jgi:integrase